MKSSTPGGLLEDFLAQVVVDDYADVTPVEDGTPRGTPHWVVVPVVLLIGLLATVAVISTRTSDEERQQTRTALADRVSALGTSVAAIGREVDERQAEVDRLQSLALDETGLASPEELAALSVQAGATAVNGPGVTVTIDDAPDAEAGSLNRVLDRDLQDIVNALWESGASGIAVNGQRLTGTTAIRGAGDAILVNYAPLTRPYVIDALGTSTSGGGDSGLSTLLRTLGDDYGLVSTVVTGDVALPAGEVRSPRFAVVESGGSAG